MRRNSRCRESGLDVVGQQALQVRGAILAGHGNLMPGATAPIAACSLMGR